MGGFLSDAAHVPGGHASGVAFPTSIDEVAALVAGADTVLPVGAQSSLTGGATPRGELVLSTRRLSVIHDAGSRAVRVGAGVALADLQQALTGRGLYYPPVPTYDGAFLGGTVATNAAGAATFKYGSTRPWVDALTIVLADGSVLDLARGRATASADGLFEIERAAGGVSRVPVPGYRMPDVAKLSAGYFAQPGMDLVDLFVGSEGTLGVVVDVTIRVIARPRQALVLATCASEAAAIGVAAALCHEARQAWRGDGPLDVAGVEYVDDRSLTLLPDEAFARAGIARPPDGARLLVAHLELPEEADAGLERLVEVLDAAGVSGDPALALPDDEAGAARIAALREAVPATVNSCVAGTKLTDGRIEKTAGDMVVPFERTAESLSLYREAFERRGLDYAIWGHLSDGNLHPNVIPRSFDDVERGREALAEIARGVASLGGAPLGEHGVGRNPLHQQLLRELYGDVGIASMRVVKQALDPTWKLSPGVLFPRPS